MDNIEAELRRIRNEISILQLRDTARNVEECRTRKHIDAMMKALKLTTNQCGDIVADNNEEQHVI